MTSSAIYDDNRKEEHKYFLKARQFYGSPTCWLHKTILLTNYSP